MLVLGEVLLGVLTSGVRCWEQGKVLVGYKGGVEGCFGQRGGTLWEKQDMVSVGLEGRERRCCGH